MYHDIQAKLEINAFIIVTLFIRLVGIKMSNKHSVMTGMYVIEKGWLNILRVAATNECNVKLLSSAG